jgi:hypothetical protein
VEAGEVLDRMGAQGMSMRAIAARLDIGRETARRILGARGHDWDTHLLISMQTQHKIMSKIE